MKINRIALNFVFVLSSTFIVGCATTHPGSEGNSIGKGTIPALKISAQNLENKPNDAFQLIEVTLENTSDEWLRLNKVDLVIGDAVSDKVSVIVGKDLSDWSQAMEYRIKKDQHNMDMAKMGLIWGGSVLANNSKSGSVGQGLGALAMLGGIGWVVADAINYDLTKAQTSEKVPENHLFRGGSIPGKLFIRRWILLNRPAKMSISNLVLKIETVEGKSDIFEIRFK